MVRPRLMRFKLAESRRAGQAPRCTESCRNCHRRRRFRARCDRYRDGDRILENFRSGFGVPSLLQETKMPAMSPRRRRGIVEQGRRGELAIPGEKKEEIGRAHV